MNKPGALIKKARDFALNAHGEQRYGDFPYSAHLDEVAGIARSYGETAEIIAYLHDVLEDTSVTKTELAATFGDHVTRCVEILSDEPGESRKIRKAATYRKMTEVEGDENLALLVKAADRLANMRACLRIKDKNFLALYQSEHDIFKHSAYRPGLCDELWSELETIQYG